MLSQINQWWNERKRAKAERIANDLPSRNPPNWSSIDGVKEELFWKEECRLIKAIRKYRSMARGTAKALLNSIEQNLWGHNLVQTPEKKEYRPSDDTAVLFRHNLVQTPGKKEYTSILARIRGVTLPNGEMAITSHDKGHVDALIEALLTLKAIDADDPEIIPIIKEVIRESDPLGYYSSILKSTLQKGDMRFLLKTPGREERRLLQLANKVNNKIYKERLETLGREEIRVLALQVFTLCAKNLMDKGKPFDDISDILIKALEDTQIDVSLSAMTALYTICDTIPEDDFARIRSRALEILNSSEVISFMAQYRRDKYLPILIEKWQNKKPLDKE